MPKPNRVNPFGELIAVPARGALLGNRGILHDEQQRIRRPFNGKRWIYCVLQFKGRRQTIMAPGHYTQLFFLDEATALAAGHRPCAECMRGRYREFQAAWSASRPDDAADGPPGADAMNAVLHAERVGLSRRKATFEERLDRLPSGAMALLPGSDEPYLARGEAPPVVWTPDGYGPSADVAPTATVYVLTPRSVVGVLSCGFGVSVHPSATADLLSEIQTREFDRRIADLDANPENVLTWDEVKGRIKKG